MIQAQPFRYRILLNTETQPDDQSRHTKRICHPTPRKVCTAGTYRNGRQREQSEDRHHGGKTLNASDEVSGDEMGPLRHPTQMESLEHWQKGNRKGRHTRSATEERRPGKYHLLDRGISPARKKLLRKQIEDALEEVKSTSERWGGGEVAHL
ncbi:uncharacterized protein [Pseudorca crassidens]|uniref:uncharacterized protein n=1 Tax=Pseudorca crassidens TaxID=82174 RepID=UPI00352F4C41